MKSLWILAALLAAAAPAPSQEGDVVRWNELTAGKSKIRFYGFLRLDAIYDDSRPNNNITPGFIRSEDPAAPPAIGSPRNRESLAIHPRLTRFGFDLDGPLVGRLGDAKATGKVEIDFYNSGLQGQSESRQAVRLRHGYLRLAWDDLSLLAGQTIDVVSPLWPAVNADFVMWGAGNLGDRRPQARLEYTPETGPGRLILQGMVGLTGANDNQDLDGGGFLDGMSSGLPTLQARAAWRQPLGAGRNLEVGLWGHRAWERADAPVAGKTRFDSQAFGADLRVPLHKETVWLMGEVWYGENLSDVRGGILQGVNTATGREIRSRGGWAELGWRPLDWYAVHAGYSTDDPRNRDLSAEGRAVNRIWYLAKRFHFDPVAMGFEYIHWTTDYVGFGKGDNNRFGMFVAYRF